MIQVKKKKKSNRKKDLKKLKKTQYSYYWTIKALLENFLQGKKQ